MVRPSRPTGPLRVCRLHGQTSAQVMSVPLLGLRTACQLAISHVSTLGVSATEGTFDRNSTMSVGRARPSYLSACGVFSCEWCSSSFCVRSRTSLRYNVGLSESIFTIIRLFQRFTAFSRPKVIPPLRTLFRSLLAALNYFGTRPTTPTQSISTPTTETYFSWRAFCGSQPAAKVLLLPHSTAPSR